MEAQPKLSGIDSAFDKGDGMSERAWCVKDKFDNLFFWTIKTSRKKAMKEFEWKLVTTWKRMYGNGFRCVEVTVKEGWE